MRIERVHTARAVMLQLFLYALPTIALMFLVMYNFNVYFNLLENDYIIQAVYFALGMVLSIVFYARNFRVSTTFAVLFLIYLLAFFLLENISYKNLDIFTTSIQFLSFVVLFSIGWLVGYGFSRWNGFTIAWVIFLLATQIYVVSRTEDIRVQNILTNFLPFIFYCFYIIYITELIKNTNDRQQNYTWLIIRKVFSFLLLFLLIFVPVFYFYNDDLKQIEKEWEDVLPQYNEKKKDTENMTRQNKDGSIENKQSTQLAGNLSRGKGLAFVAYLDNFLEDGTANPLYFTSYYYTKFDTITQTFEVDNNIPLDDLYKPDPSKIPLYFTDIDSSVIRNSMSSLGRKEVSAEIYKAMLSPDEYLAPATAFFCQPISVPKDNRLQFKSAYKAKMWVSELNSVYFVYNSGGDPDTEAFQSRRDDILRADTNYSLIDKDFIDYYTQIPKTGSFNQIAALANQIVVHANAQTPVEKINAIKNFYLQTDEFGQPLFSYSDNPGVPGLPSASRLTYFLFENRKGYCTYFAGTTLFLLRSLGIPSRIAAGFLTIDRSSKNEGWYWFYEDQAHAWVQVFFPTYGWIDFDTTIPDVNASQSTKPDGTPPLGMSDATFVADGHIMSVDTMHKTAEININKIIINQKDFTDSTYYTISADISLANIITDTAVVDINALKPDMHITAVSFQPDLGKSASAGDKIEEILAELPQLIPIDEIKIIEKEEAEKPLPMQKTAVNEELNWLKILTLLLFTLVAIVVLLAAMPFLIFLYYLLNVKKSVHKQNRAILYYLNQMGYYRYKTSPLIFAENIDEIFGTEFAKFTAIYQKWKYSNGNLNNDEKNFIAQHFDSFMQNVREKIPLKKRINNFLNVYVTLHFFVKN